MRKLTATEVRDLQDGQSVYVRLSRAGRTGWVTQYDGPATLYVQRFKGVAVCVTPASTPDWTEAYAWAESDPRRDLTSDGSLITEDYQMEIFTNA